MARDKKKHIRYPDGVNRFEFHKVEVSELPSIIKNNKKGKRNNGLGDSARYAMVKAIKNEYEKLYPNTSRKYLGKTHVFSDWLKLQGINDLTVITQSIYDVYAWDLKRLVEKVDYKPSYAVSLMSASNMALRCVRDHKNKKGKTKKKITVSPSSIAKRSSVRTTTPLAYNNENMMLAINDLYEKNKCHTGMLIHAIYNEGLRCKEATMLDAKRQKKECDESKENTGTMSCRIIEGAKGGLGRLNVKTPLDKKGRPRKRFDRIIYPDQATYQLIVELADEQGERKCMIPSELSPKQQYNKIQNDWYPISKKYGLGGLHDIRSAYACWRYLEITGYPAPVISGCVRVSKEEDEAARKIISKEMGHNRTDVLVSYIGGKRSLKPVHTRKVDNHNQAYFQASNFLSFGIHADDFENINIAERASKVIHNIYLDNEVGIFNIEYAHIQGYINKFCCHLKGKVLQQLRITLTYLIEKIYKNEWLELLEDDLNSL